MQILIDDIQTAIEQREFAGLILLDAEKAFERIPHNALAVALLKTGAPLKLVTSTINFIKKQILARKTSSSAKKWKPEIRLLPPKAL